MIKKEELFTQPTVRNIKYGTVEQVLGTCKMKDSQKGWTIGVIYQGPDRCNTGMITIFCKNIDDFCEEFELVSSVENKKNEDGINIAKEFWASAQG